MASRSSAAEMTEGDLPKLEAKIASVECLMPDPGDLTGAFMGLPGEGAAKAKIAEDNP
jgi:hypothetical protein